MTICNCIQTGYSEAMSSLLGNVISCFKFSPLNSPISNRLSSSICRANEKHLRCSRCRHCWTISLAADVIPFPAGMMSSSRLRRTPKLYAAETRRWLLRLNKYIFPKSCHDNVWHQQRKKKIFWAIGYYQLPFLRLAPAVVVKVISLCTSVAWECHQQEGQKGCKRSHVFSRDKRNLPCCQTQDTPRK